MRLHRVSLTTVMRTSWLLKMGLGSSIGSGIDLDESDVNTMGMMKKRSLDRACEVNRAGQVRDRLAFNASTLLWAAKGSLNNLSAMNVEISPARTPPQHGVGRALGCLPTWIHRIKADAKERREGEERIARSEEAFARSA